VEHIGNFNPKKLFPAALQVRFPLQEQTRILIQTYARRQTVSPLSPSRPFWQVGLRWAYGWLSLTKSATAWLHSNRYNSPRVARQRLNMEKQLHLQYWRDTEAFRLTSSIGTCWVHVIPPYVTRTSGLKSQQRQWKTVWHVRNSLEVCLKPCTVLMRSFKGLSDVFLLLSK